MDESFAYKAHLLEVRRSYWPNPSVEHYVGFVDGCRVSEEGLKYGEIGGPKYGWIGGFDSKRVKARLMAAVDAGVFEEQAV
jgi:hypothetical protein